MKIYYSLILVLCFSAFCSTKSISQGNHNGTLDDLTEFATKTTLNFTMPDGTVLKTDMFLPITGDSMLVPINLNLPTIGSVNAVVEAIPRGVQYIIYDSLNGAINPNPYQLPAVFTRTPYNKDGDNGAQGTIFSVMGYTYFNQDMRGRFASGGAYLPMYSDGWNKNPYHPTIKHKIDITSFADPRNANKHEDGYNSINLILSQQRTYNSQTFNACDGSIGMFGASALGNSQLQLASAHKINPLLPGLKCLQPIVATNEHFTVTGMQNGVFRETMVEGWISGQYDALDDGQIPNDTSLNNDIHTSADFNLPDKHAVAQGAIEHFVSERYNGLHCGYYPDSPTRCDMDASFAPVDASGEGDANGQYSRYTNLEVPMMHISGWWDIFIDGQIFTNNLVRRNVSTTYGNNLKQKIIIGPWAHQTIGNTTTGDMTYPINVKDIFQISPDDVGGNINNINVGAVLRSELLSWYRYNLNYRSDHRIGEPKILLPRSERWQQIYSAGLITIFVRVPANDVKLTYGQFIGFIAGQSSISVPIEIKTRTCVNYPWPPYQSCTDAYNSISYTVPAMSPPLFTSPTPISGIQRIDYSASPNVRFYVVGPADTLTQPLRLGNYWFASDTFPLVNNINWVPMYLHANKKADMVPQLLNEGNLSYTHDPNNPVRTIGGGNMIEGTPTGGRASQGQMNLKTWESFTMDSARVLSFVSPPVQDSLCVIGFPVADIYAKTSPDTLRDNGLTDTDFFVRIADVYPDGNEYFVVEGCVNARAKDYAKVFAEGDENPNIPFNNIRIDSIYRFKFKMMPLGYTFGKNHKVKILISSSNYGRYQVNPNVPIEQGEFFRRKPNDGQSYTYQGMVYPPRVAQQTVYFSTEFPSEVRLPVYGHYPSVQITGNPANVSVCDDETAVFDASASGDSLIYQWQVNSGNGWINLTDNSHYTGSDSTTLVISGSDVAFNNNQYRFVSSNSWAGAAGNPATLLVSEEPEVSGESGDLIVYNGNDTTINLQTVLAGNNQHYRWFHNDIEILSNDQNTYAIIAADTSDAGDYYCIVFNGCGSDTSRLIAVEVSPQSIQDISKDNKIYIYPNPAKDLVNIRFTLPGKYIIRVYTISGQLIYEKNVNADYDGYIEKMDVNTLPEGCYFLKINNKEYNGYTKLVKY